MNERLKFVAAAQSGHVSMTELCRRFGICRKTGYKLVDRYECDGLAALRDRSRAPHRHPNQTAPVLEGAILRVRKRHPTWGSKKILAVLQREWDAEDLPPGDVQVLAFHESARERSVSLRLDPRQTARVRLRQRSVASGEGEDARETLDPLGKWLVALGEDASEVFTRPLEGL